VSLLRFYRKHSITETLNDFTIVMYTYIFP